MLKMELCCEEEIQCPKCGAELYQKLYKDERKIYLVCEVENCGYEKTVTYDKTQFNFVYRDEFYTEIIAENLEEAIKKLDNAIWKRTDFNLWQDYFEVKYKPIYCS